MKIFFQFILFMSKYYCEKCHYSTDLKNSYNKHLLSIKHLSENVYNFKCECNKEFQTKSGLSKHKLNCNIRPIINQVINTPNVDIRTQIREVLNEILEKKDYRYNKSEQKIQYIYLLQEREFVISKTPIYKIGKSKQENVSRFRQYPKGSSLLFQITCNDCDLTENILKKIFAEKYIKRPEIGSEYFEGDSKQMIKDIFNIING